MFPLILDVLDYIRDLRLADRKDSITILPAEFSECRELIVDPFR